jgi:hypothetical protein
LNDDIGQTIAQSPGRPESGERCAASAERMEPWIGASCLFGPIKASMLTRESDWDEKVVEADCLEYFDANCRE